MSWQRCQHDVKVMFNTHTKVLKTCKYCIFSSWVTGIIVIWHICGYFYVFFPSKLSDGILYVIFNYLSTLAPSLYVNCYWWRATACNLLAKILPVYIKILNSHQILKKKCTPLAHWWLFNKGMNDVITDIVCMLLFVRNT